MKELKHLIYFESLLEDANNELVRKAEAEGDLAIGYTCFHAPEVLLNLGNCFSVRLRAPHTNSMELATYYMANNSCEFSRALLERALEGNYSFLHAMAGVDVCEANNRAIENMEIMHMQGEDKEKFFYCNLDMPSSNPVATIFAWSGALRKRGEIDGSEELAAFGERLEKATVDTLESGVMTGDLALLCKGQSDVKSVSYTDFLNAVAEKLR